MGLIFDLEALRVVNAMPNWIPENKGSPGEGSVQFTGEGCFGVTLSGPSDSGRSKNPGKETCLSPKDQSQYDYFPGFNRFSSSSLNTRPIGIFCPATSNWFPSINRIFVTETI
jgi:hypothetical protein